MTCLAAAVALVRRTEMGQTRAALPGVPKNAKRERRCRALIVPWQPRVAWYSRTEIAKGERRCRALIVPWQPRVAWYSRTEMGQTRAALPGLND